MYINKYAICLKKKLSLNGLVASIMYSFQLNSLFKILVESIMDIISFLTIPINTHALEFQKFSYLQYIFLTLYSCLTFFFKLSNLFVGNKQCIIEVFTRTQLKLKY